MVAIENTSGNQLVHYSNRKGSFWSGETREYKSHWSTGFYRYRERLFGELQLQVDQIPLSREQARIRYTPVRFERVSNTGISETLFMPDGEHALVYSWRGIPNGTQGFKVIVQDVKLIGSGRIDSTQSSSRIVWPLDAERTQGLSVHTPARILSSRYEADSRELHLELEPTLKPGDESDLALDLVIEVGTTVEALMNPPAPLLSRKDELLDQKEQRLQQLFQDHVFQTEDTTLQQAWFWSLASFDALQAEEQETGLGIGIYAGFPWFQDFWGRDSFIALRALTVTGQWEPARRILESFLRFQVMDPGSPDYGKIPNRVRPDEVIYNTADATPRFLIEADRYRAYTSDTAFARQLYPHIRAAIEGTLTYRTDASGFIVHQDADTWMDAKGPQGPYSPRGPRATDIQALWIDALSAASSLVRYSTEPGSVALQQKLDSLHTTVKQAYISRFFADLTTPTPRFYDVLQDKGPSDRLRPNVLFGIHLLPEAQMRRAIVQHVTRGLGTPWGLLSLSAQDPWFHPYHKAEPLYEQDASYHNGIVWLWNSGIWVEHLIRHGQLELASELTQNYAEVMMRNVTLGTLPELMDALPRRGIFATRYPDQQEFPSIARLDQLSIRNAAEVAPHIPALSGAWSQAWSLSEFIRTITDDYTGLQYHIGKGFQLVPQFPQSWGNVLVIQTFAHYRMELRRQVGKDQNEWFIRFSAEKGSLPMEVPFYVSGMEQPVRLKLSGAEDRYIVRKERGKWMLRRNDQKFEAEETRLYSGDPEGQQGAARWPRWEADRFPVDQRSYKSQLKP